ncbi:MAG: hypothetical protein P4L56_00560 [Candidatus Sulfopaludibacter sp.]|nr:hypothetical protein [Candidatus Sulfopaludibacter sp.]
MTLPYVLRLLCLCGASFFLLHLALGLAVTLLTPAAARLAGRMRPRRAARFLLALRLFPAAFSVLVVAGLCTPSYLLLEPASTREEVSLWCVLSALLCVTLPAFSVVRCVRAARRSLGYIRCCQLAGRQEHLAGESAPVWVVEGSAPFMVLAGIVRPRLIVSRPVVNALPVRQLAAAMRHEHAHRISRDNFKRLLLLLAPDLFPLWRGFAQLERVWARFAEWAADDYAVAGDSQRSVSLASALVSVARLGACPQAAPLITSLLADDRDLAERVDRLLRDVPQESGGERRSVAVRIAGIMVSGLLLALMVQPATLSSVHGLLEHLTH